MKKVLLLTVMCVLGLFTVRAQETSFSYNFDDGALTGWRTFTGEGHVGEGWGISPEVPTYYPATYHTIYKGVDETNAVVSMAYKMLAGQACKPNCYIVTESKYLITATSKLSWFAKVPMGNPAASEQYYVVISEDNETWTQVFGEVCPANENREYAFSSEYVGKELYIGFQHIYQGASSGANDAVVLDNIVLTGDDNTGDDNTGDDNTGEDPETPGEDPETPGEDPETPGEDPETPGEDPETPGEDPETPGEDPETPGEDPETPGEDPETPGEDPETPGEEPGEEPTEPEEPGEDAEFLICERFENYEVGDKIAEKGHDCWTTWSTTEGGAEEGVIAELDGQKCAHFTKGNDQVILLGDFTLGRYEIEFDIYVPNGKTGYYNILHSFAGSSSVWAMQAYLHMTDDGNQNQVPSAGNGTIHAGGNSTENLECVYDAWMHFRFDIDIDKDLATFYCTLPEAEEKEVYSWQWSKESFDGLELPDRQLGAMNFYPPLKDSEFYMDNFTLKKTSGETAPEISFEEEIKQWSLVDELAYIDVTFENTGTSIADYTAWIDYGEGKDSDKVEVISYAGDIDEESAVLGLNIKEPTIIELGAMYTASAYSSSVSGTKITHVMYPFAEIEEGAGFGIVKGSDVVFRIYRQGYNGQPGECLAEKTVPYSELKSEWISAELDEPVVLGGFNVWATVSMLQAVPTNSKSEMPMVFDNKAENLAPYGDVIRLNNEGPFYLVNELFSQSYGNVHIAIVCAGDPVFGGWAELEKVDGVLPIGETATMKINFNAFGLEAGKTYEAKVVFAVNNVDELFEAPLLLQVCGENVEELLSNTYNIYPNPTTGMVTVEGDNINYVAVYNSVGQLVKVVKTQNSVVDMSAYDNGVYFFNVVDNAGQSSVQRVVVAK